MLRNGVEIGRARATIPPTNAPRVLTMSGDPFGEPLWRPAGDTTSEPLPLDAAIAGVLIPEPFLTALSGAIDPGATILVTSAPVDGAMPRTPGIVVTTPSTSNQTTPSFF